MKNWLSRRKKILIFLLIILFHIGILLILFFINMDADPDYSRLLEALRQKQAAQQHEEEWAATKARASHFGAPVIFQEEPEYEQQMPTESPTPPSPQTEHTEHEQETHKEELIDQKTAETTRVITEKKEEPPEKKPPEKPEKENKPIQQPREAHIDEHKAPGTGKKYAAPIEKSSITMADLAQGFLHEMHHNGDHNVTMLGKEGARASEHQLKIERYAQRLNWHLQNAFNMHRNKMREPHEATYVSVYLSLARSGKLRDLRLIQSSGNRSLDEYTLFIFQEASSSFPPVPNFLPDDPFSLSYRVEYNSVAPSHFRFNAR